MQHEGKRIWNVIFLLDQTPPTKMLLLQRSPLKTLAPGFYTGIGGKLESHESLLESAYRELREETGLEGLALTHFANVFLQSPTQTDMVSCFTALLPQETVPLCTEGELSWVKIPDVFQKHLMPTARIFLTQWQKRRFSLSPWTLTLRVTGEKDGVQQVVLDRIGDGLYTE